MKRNLFLILLSLSFTSQVNAQYFSKITTGAIVTDLGDSRSVNWVDVNNDGSIDCFISNGPSGGQHNRLYLNMGDGTFSAVTDGEIVTDGTPSDGATFADIDNDGDLDAFVVNWYNVNNLLYTNDGNGNFTRITSGPPVSDLGYSETASFGDYNNDGLIDLYVTNSAGAKKNFLYQNSGTGTWIKITTGSPVEDNSASRNVSWTDLNEDGYQDLFVTNEYGANEHIYINDGDGAFETYTTGALVHNGGNTNSSSWGDYDNDGDLDVFLANYDGYNAIFRNEGSLNFTKIETDTAALTFAHSFSSAWSDIDNDGDLDLFVTNAFLDGSQLTNFLYINNGDGSFTRNGTDISAIDSSWSYGCAFGDYDNDGFQDLMVATCRYDGTDQVNLLYHNNGNDNNWVTFSLEGTHSNRSAIGAIVRIKATIDGNPVWQMREISSQSSYCGQNDLRAHFGLGDADLVDSLIITWPLGSQSIYTSLEPNQNFYYSEPGSISIDNNSGSETGIIIFPNPSAGEVIIKNKQLFQTGDILTITDNQGTIIQKTDLGGKSEIKVIKNEFRIPAGIYYFQISKQDQIWVKKVIFK